MSKNNHFRRKVPRNNSGRVGGGLHREERTEQRVNLHTCGTCGARPGEPCYSLGATRYIEYNRTHSGIGVRRDEQKPSTAPPTAEELATRKLSTTALDRRHQARKAREARNQRKVNGL